jgi:precorrin-6B methylase 2
MSADALKSAVSKFCQSCDALAVIGLALERNQGSGNGSARFQPHAGDALRVLGLDQAVTAASPAERRAMLAQIRVFMLTSAKLLSSHPAKEWSFTDRAILESAGEVSAAFPSLFKSKILPNLEGLGERLSAPGSAFLDIGLGVGAMSVEMARLWPELRIVGIDPLPEAVALAHKRVRAEGLQDRISLRIGRAEDMIDETAFDLAWLPSLFITEFSIPAILARVQAALTPGGWLLFPLLKANDDALSTALARFRAASFGGFVGTTAKAREMLHAAGFKDVRAIRGEPTSLTSMIVARK